MEKYIIWGLTHKNLIVALTEDLSSFAQGETFWKAVQNLLELNKNFIPSKETEETDVSSRLNMYQNTGVNKVEILIDKEKNKYAVKCANSRSFFDAADIKEALKKYIEGRAATSVINTGDLLKDQ